MLPQCAPHTNQRKFFINCILIESIRMFSIVSSRLKRISGDCTSLANKSRLYSMTIVFQLFGLAVFSAIYISLFTSHQSRSAIFIAFGTCWSMLQFVRSHLSIFHVSSRYSMAFVIALDSKPSASATWLAHIGIYSNCHELL